MAFRSPLVRVALVVPCSAAILCTSATVAGAASTRVPVPPTPRPQHLAPPVARAAQLRMTRGRLAGGRLVVSPRFE
jgi:hypothetical protein